MNIKNADEKVEIKLNKQVQLSPEFKDLWDRIKWKTRYNVDFDSNKLIEECVKAISDKVIIGSSVINETKATLNISQGGITTDETQNRSRSVDETENILPDIVSYLQNETNLTRKTIADILLKSNTLDGFKRNPQLYMSEVSKHIKNIMKQMAKEGKTIFFSTHILDVAEKLCDRVAIIKNGKIVKIGEMKEIKGDTSLEEVFLELGEK